MLTSLETLLSPFSIFPGLNKVSFLSIVKIFNWESLKPSYIGWHDPGKTKKLIRIVLFLYVTLQRSFPFTEIGDEFQGCVLASEGCNLSNVPIV